MRQSLSSAERGNPPPRRKSCTGCIKAKRRCDLGWPACLRCSQRKMECRYPPTPAAKRKINRAGDSVQALQGDSSVPNSELPLGLSHWDLQLGQLEPAASLTSLMENNSPQMDCSLSMLDYIMDTPEDTLNGILAVEPSPAQLDLTPYPQYTPMQQATLISTRFQYALDEIIKAPKTMVFETQTPWCHPQLYKDHMPRSMQGRSGSSSRLIMVEE